MAFMSLFRHGVMVSLLFCFVCDSTTAFGFGKKVGDSILDVLPVDPRDLATLIRRAPEDQSGIYNQALELLNSMQTSPSCHRLATSTLLYSCQSVSGSKHSSEASLDDTRSFYAAQLAVCEIRSANSIVPQACEILTPDLKTGLQKFAAHGANRAHLSQCLQALESKPQWWTSYSNSRQNAVVICQAARVDVEKDELIKLHKSFIQTSRDADVALARAVGYSNETLKQQHRDSVLVKKALQEQLVRDIEDATGRTQSFFDQFIGTLDAGFQTILTRVTSATRSAETDFTNLHENIQSARAKSHDLEKNIGRVFQKAAEGTAEIASLQMKHLDESSEFAAELQWSLKHVMGLEVRQLESVIREMHGQLQITSDLVISMSARQKNMDTQLNQVGQYVIGLQAQAEALHVAQLRQETTQSRLQNAMEAGLNASLERLAIIERSATKLQDVLQEASQSTANIALLVWIVSKFWIWGSLAVLLILEMFGILGLDRNVAKFVAAALGVIVIAKSSFTLLVDLVSRRSPSIIQLPLEQMVIFGFVIGILISVGCFCRHESSQHSNMHTLGLTSSERKLRHIWSV